MATISVRGPRGIVESDMKSIRAVYIAVVVCEEEQSVLVFRLAIDVMLIATLEAIRIFGDCGRSSFLRRPPSAVRR